MSVLGLSRFQFGMTTIFHFLFVPFSVGMGIAVSIIEALYVIKKDDTYKRMAKFWGNIYLLSFAVGVVTGIIQEFQFGMNWSQYSRFVGDIFGAPLAFEALIAFFMESTFLGLWIFTWDKVKPWLHMLFIWLTAIGSVASGYFILTANAFMQHPVGYVIKNGRAEMSSVGALLGNYQVWNEFFHAILAATLMGGIVIAGLSAFQMLCKRKQHVGKTKFYKLSIRIGLVLTFIGSLGTMMSGDIQMRDLATQQPMKFSAMESVYKNTGSPASWSLIGWANEKDHKNDFSVEIPYMLSILTYHKTTGSVEGMNNINREFIKKYGKDNNYYPPVNLLFYCFRFMAGMSGILLLASIVGLIMLRGKKETLFKHRWLLWILGFLTFAPFLICTAGWLITEEGRQPWTVYGLFTTAQSVSPTATVGSMLTSNIVYFVLFTCLSIAMVYLTYLELKKGPFSIDIDGNKLNSVSYDPFDKEALEK